MAAGVGMMLVRTLQAVHDLAFELEGDIATQGSSNYPSFHNGTVDWQSFFSASTNADAFGGASLPVPTGTTPGGGTFTSSGFVRDFKTTATTRRGVTTISFDTSDSSTYTTGSKDILGINGTGSNHWQCTPANNVTDKGDIMNSYATTYTGPDGKQYLYFAMERSANTGDANVAFWFLQDKVGCDGSGGTATFTGHHSDGDVLIVSAFTNGGSVSGINAYRWTCQSNGVPLQGVACDDAPNNPVAVPLASGSDCRISTGASQDNICASSNTDGTQAGLPVANGVAGTIDVPWLTFSKTLGLDHKLPTSQFFEGGINLTNTNLGGKCFNDFLGDTRSSQSLTASLYDFANGSLGQCGSSTTTASSNISGTTYIPLDPSASSVAVTDTATVTVTGVPTFDGSVTFHLCGPTDLGGTGFTCGTGGVLIGTKATQAGGQSSPWVVSSSGLTANVTAAGRYCWRAEFTAATDGVPDSDDTAQSDAATKECFVITPQNSAVSTTATTGPVTFGSKISDTVTINNTAHEPGSGGSADSTTINGFAATINATTPGVKAGGTITVEAYGPDSCNTLAFGPVSLTLGSGAVPRVTNSTGYGGAGSTFEFTPTAPGQYVFVASYSGDLPNTLGNGATGSTACLGAPASEKVTVRTIPTSITTTPRAYPNDSATITSSISGNNLAAGGTIVFKLFQSANGATASQNCAANGSTGLLYTQTFTNQPAAAATSVTASTTNYPSNAGAVAVSVADTVYWRVTYAPAAADTAHTGIQSACVENNGLTFTAEAGPGTAFP